MGSTLLESKLGAEYDLTAIALVRGSKTVTKLERDSVIEADDILLLEGSADNLLRARDDSWIGNCQ